MTVTAGRNGGLEITGSHRCGGETFQSIFNLLGWKFSNKSLRHSDDRLLFPALHYGEL